jgi:hypothetical protein
LAGQQVVEDTRKAGVALGGLAISPTSLFEVVEHDVDGATEIGNEAGANGTGDGTA